MVQHPGLGNAAGWVQTRGDPRVHLNAKKHVLPLVGCTLRVVGPKATHLPHEGQEKEQMFQRVLREPLTPWFSPLVWAMRMAGSKLEETLGLL